MKLGVTTAAARAVVQLVLPAVVIGVALQHLALALAFVVLVVMHVVAVLPAAQRRCLSRDRARN